jgi:TPP-dependent pyruvate/acetoin dehydrogenase alpha subunit
MEGKGRVAAAFFGDGAANEGAFHEGLNLAAVWKLPALFVCENNVYGFSTHYQRTMLVEDIATRGAAYGMPGVVVDGMDVEAVRAAASEAVARARRGDGPTLLECKTYRYMGHSRFEPSTYRSKEELAEWKKRDPIAALRLDLLTRSAALAEELDRIEAETVERVEDAVRFAEQSPDPAPEAWREMLWASPLPAGRAR